MLQNPIAQKIIPLVLSDINILTVTKSSLLKSAFGYLIPMMGMSDKEAREFMTDMRDILTEMIDEMDANITG